MDLNEALKGLTRRQLTDLQTQIKKELEACALCGNIGAKHFKIQASGRGSNSFIGSINLCMPCFEKIREIPSLAETT